MNFSAGKGRLFFYVAILQFLSVQIFSFVFFSSAFGAATDFSGAAGYSADVFKVSHPRTVSTGDAFVLRLASGKPDGALQGELQVVWLDKIIPLGVFGAEAEPRHGNPENFECILAVPLDCAEKKLPLKIVLALPGQPEKNLYAASITVSGKEFAAQALSVKPEYVDPGKEILERIKLESKKNSELLSTVTKVRHWRLPLLRPVPGVITGEFGLRRVFNGQPRSRHKGVDFRGAEGVPIRSCAAGRVVLAEDQYYSGNFVIIDHGLGVFSLYAHLSAFRVRSGDMVQAGQIIGEVGKTGRVTGPHLHFGLSVLGVAADPASLGTL
jgi:murein DD-endopeptidase MepM/ murein hydrolase activator NlpD